MGVLLLSARGAGAYLGPAGFLAMAAAAAKSVPGRHFGLALDCGDAPGLALAAIRARVPLVILDAGLPGFAQVATAAVQIGVTVRGERPPALDLAGLDLQREAVRQRITSWLNSGPPR